MPVVVPLFPPVFRPLPGDCSPYVEQAVRGIETLVEHHAMTEPDWARLNLMQARCISCGQCPRLASQLLMTPRRIVRRPVQSQAPPHERPVRPAT